MIQFSNLCLAAGLISAASVVAAFHNCPSGSPAAKTANGTVCDVNLPSFSLNAFLGVPFAQPPLKSLRLKHPVSLNSSYDSYAANAQPPSCPGYAGFEVGIVPLSQDCLYLKCTIVVQDCQFLIYGGGFVAGGVADPRYNMSYLVQEASKIGKPVLGVSINYQVGGWGFLASKEILADGSANIGLYDQRMALQWLRENIAGFGGNPDQITIWGESAGAFSVGYHLIGFDGQHDDMFRAAILESGTMLGSALQDAETMALEDGYQAMYDNVTETVGYATEDSLACLQTVLFETLFSAFKPQVYTPIIDGEFIRRRPSESLALGKVAEVAALLGANTDEGTASFWGPRGTLNNTEDVATYISEPEWRRTQRFQC